MLQEQCVVGDKTTTSQEDQQVGCVSYQLLLVHCAIYITYVYTLHLHTSILSLFSVLSYHLCYSYLIIIIWWPLLRSIAF
jgi:hypothetical protein